MMKIDRLLTCISRYLAKAIHTYQHYQSDTAPYSGRHYHAPFIVYFTGFVMVRTKSQEDMKRADLVGVR